MKILAISGSPSPQSSGARLADHLRGRIPAGIETGHLRLADLDPAALLRAETGHPDIAAARARVAAADGIILVTPVYKAAYSGLLKCFLDLLDQYALAGKAVLPAATAGSLAHALAIDYALRPVLHSMGARHVVQGVVLLPQHVRAGVAPMALEPRAEAMFAAALEHFLSALSDDPDCRLRGHPEPARGLAVP